MASIEFEGRHQELAGDRPIGGKIGGDAGAEAEAEGVDALRRHALDHGVVDQERIGEQRLLGGRTTGWRIATKVEDDDVDVVEAIGDEGRAVVGIPAIAREADDEPAAGASRAHEIADDGLAVAGAQLQPFGALGQRVVRFAREVTPVHELVLHEVQGTDIEAVERDTAEDQVHLASPPSPQR